MKRLFYLLAIVAMGTVVSAQNNIKVDRFLLLNIEEIQKNTQLETHIVPEGKVWSIESVLTNFETHSVTMIIGEEEYHIAFGEVRRSVVLPFYLPSGTKFQLGSKEGSAIASIQVLIIE